MRIAQYIANKCTNSYPYNKNLLYVSILSGWSDQVRLPDARMWRALACEQTDIVFADGVSPDGWVSLLWQAIE